MEQPARAQFIQQGPKLVGSGNIGSSLQGNSVAISADGHTAIVGGNDDNSGAGAAWVFILSNGTWTQQAKLVGTPAANPAFQGQSVALSDDGNTAIVGGSGDNNDVGAAWVWTRSAGVWTQQAKLVAFDAVGAALQGSVALSGDGNTAIVGGPGDNNYTGAAWVWIRSAGVWTQQGTKLAIGGYGSTKQGRSVALSADGNTAVVGAPGFSTFGLAWVWTRSGGVWSEQQVLELIEQGLAGLGFSVALSRDGNIAILGGPGSFNNAGGAFKFIHNGLWEPFGEIDYSNPNFYGGTSVALSPDGKELVGVPGYFSTGAANVAPGSRILVGNDAGGDAQQGTSVALSCNTAIVGGPFDSGSIGAAWVFVAPPTDTHDFNLSCLSDIVWRDGSGNIAVWLMNGATVLSSGGVGGVSGTWSIVGQRDFNGDGKADLLWRDSSGNTSIWFMNGAAVASSLSVGNVPTNWSVVGVADFNGDGMGDLLWRDTSGDIAVWLMSGATVSSSTALGNVPTTWTVVGTGDFNGDGMADILWRDNLGNTAIWFMNGTLVASTAGVGNIPTNWSVVGTGDFNGDGKSDIVWSDTVGDTSIWLMNGAGVLSAGALGNVGTTWSIVQTGDYNGDRMSDLLWRDNLGNTSMWFMNGTTIASTRAVGNIPTNWTVQSVNAE
jgi:hypothetical protein